LSRISLSDSEDSEDDEPFRQPPNSAAKTFQAPAVVFETDKSGDVLLAIYCLLQDFLEIRLTVRCNWHMFVDDSGPKDDLFTAAVVTQGANELIHILVNDFLEQYPQLTSIEDIAALLLESGSSQIVDTPAGPQKISETNSDRSTSLKAERHELAELFQRTYLETFNKANAATMEKGGELQFRYLDSLTEQNLQMMRNTRKKQTPLSGLQSCIGNIKHVQEDSSMGHQELLPDSDTFTRLWYDAIKPESGGLKPGLEQVLVTQLFLNVKTVMDRHDHLQHQHTQLMLPLLGDTETVMRLLNHKPPAVQLPTIPQEVSLAAYPHQGYPSMDIPKEAMLAMNTLCVSNPV
jgi:hypothetical protein